MPKLGDRYARALITGAGSGLGKAFAEALIEEGVTVWGTSRNPGRLPKSDQLFPVNLDLTGKINLRNWYHRWDGESGGFDLVINNAGYAVLGSVSRLSVDEVNDQISVLLTGPIQLAGAAIDRMRNRKAGCLVNVSSVAGEMWVPYLPVYNSAKMGLSAFSQSLMLENPTTAPWVVDFRPGDYRTAFNERMGERPRDSGFPEAVWRRMEQLLSAAPGPEVAARDLLASLRQFRHCTQYSGSFVQTCIAPLCSRLLPNSFKRKILRSYYQIP